MRRKLILIHFKSGSPKKSKQLGKKKTKGKNSKSLVVVKKLIGKAHRKRQTAGIYVGSNILLVIE
jgi:hypothetical protein